MTVYPNYGAAMLHLKAFPDVELEFVQTRKEKNIDHSCRNLRLPSVALRMTAKELLEKFVNGRISNKDFADGFKNFAKDSMNS